MHSFAPESQKAKSQTRRQGELFHSFYRLAWICKDVIHLMFWSWGKTTKTGRKELLRSLSVCLSVSLCISLHLCLTLKVFTAQIHDVCLVVFADYQLNLALTQFYSLKTNLILKSTDVLSYCAYLTGAIPKGLILWRKKKCFIFVLHSVDSREFVVWWLVCRINRRQIKFVFSPDIILCDWLGSKYLHVGQHHHCQLRCNEYCVQHSECVEHNYPLTDRL